MRFPAWLFIYREELVYTHMMQVDEYTVSLWVTKMPFPLQFTVHAWFVLEHGGVVDRYEVWATFGRFEETTVFVNAIAPHEGFRSSFFDSIQNPKKKSLPWKVGEISGTEGSVANDMYHFIKRTPATYPALKRYRMIPGPNSNTYVAWVLSHFDSSLRLPWNAFGKGYKLDKTN